MASNFYVDSSATGTGDGTSPTNAAMNVTSLFSTLTSADLGSIVWVRRNFIQPPADTRSMNWGLFTSNNSINVNSHPMTWIVGWPNSGDPFYEERPAAGVSAGWDSDTPPHMLWPTIVYSSGGSGIDAGQQMRRMHGATNFTLVRSGGSLSSDVLGASGIFSTRGYLGSIGVMDAAIGQLSLRQVDHLVICASVGGSNLGWCVDGVKKITLTQSTFYSGTLASGYGCLYNTMQGWRVEEIVVLSNSISALFTSRNNAQDAAAWVGRIRGTRPVSADVIPDGTSEYGAYIVDDYYGQPAILHPRGSELSHIPSSAGVAVFSGTAARRTLANSIGFASATLGNAYFQRRDQAYPVRNRIAVTSGVPVTLRLHFATAGVGSLEWARGTAKIAVAADGCGSRLCTIPSSGIRIGSAGLWTGSLTGVESYYMMYAVFTPKESAVVDAFAALPLQQNVGSHGNAIYYSPFFEVGST